MRTIRYKEIAESIRERVQGGAYAPGHVLPSEAELSAEFGSSRPTIRSALETLREEGLLASRQGFGWFVAAEPLREAPGRVGTIEDQLAASGLSTDRRLLEFAFTTADERVRKVLDVDQVLWAQRLKLVDGEPFAVVNIWCPTELAGDFSRNEVDQTPFYDLLDLELGGATQTMCAVSIGPDDAVLLGVPVGSPVIRCERVTTTVDGRPVLFSEHLLPGHRIEFVVDLPHNQVASSPAGMRLVDPPAKAG